MIELDDYEQYTAALGEWLDEDEDDEEDEETVTASGRFLSVED